MATTTVSDLPLLTVTARVHQDSNGDLLLLNLAVAEPDGAPASPAKIALVLDRSASMEGDPMRIAAEGAAKFVRTLSPLDSVAVVAYDDRVETVAPLGPPSEAVARRTEAVDARGSTALYDGWLAGARLAGRGGRVVLLSDGHANVGAYTDAESLSCHAGLSYEKYRVTTSTIGIGEGYDTELMHGMARAGKGGHYFAPTLDALTEALSAERHALASAALSFVTLKVGNTLLSVGNLWRGEERRLVVPIASIETGVTLRLTDAVTGERRTHTLNLPDEIGTHPEATLQIVLDAIAAAETESGTSVHDPRSAERAARELRALLLALMGHPLADTAEVVAERARLESSIARLKSLAQSYDENAANLNRKRAMQNAANLAAPDQAYSAVMEDRLLMRSARAGETGTLDSATYALLPPEVWVRLGRVPVTGERNGAVRLIAADPRDGFRQKELEALLPHLTFTVAKGAGDPVAIAASV